MDKDHDSSSIYMNQLHQTANLNKKKLAEIKNSIQEFNIKLHSLKNEVQNLQKQLFFQTAYLTEWELKIKFNVKQIAVLRDNKTSLETKIEDAKRNLEINEQTLKRNRDDFSTKVFEISKEIVNGKVRIPVLKSDFEREIKNYSFELNQMGKEILEIKQNIEIIDNRNYSKVHKLGPNTTEKLKTKKEGLAKQLQTLNKKLDKCLIVKEKLTNAPANNPEFRRLKWELQKKNNRLEASRMVPSIIEKGVQQPVKISTANRKLKQMLNQRRLDEFWSVTK